MYYIMFHVCLQVTTPLLVTMDCGIRPSLSSVLCNVPCMSTDDDASPGNYGLWNQAAAFCVLYNVPCMSADDDASPGNYGLWHQAAALCVLYNVPCMSIDNDASPGSYGLWHQAITL